MVRYVGDTTETFRLDLGVGALASVSALSKLLYQVALSGSGHDTLIVSAPIICVPYGIIGGEMDFKLTRVEWDRKTERAYVELRSEDPDGGEAFAVATFSYRTIEAQTKTQRKEDLTRKARHMLKRAGIAA